jgi:hypothetical protein
VFFATGFVLVLCTTSGYRTGLGCLAGCGALITAAAAYNRNWLGTASALIALTIVAAAWLWDIRAERRCAAGQARAAASWKTATKVSEDADA